MNRYVLLLFTLVACTSSAPAERYGFIARRGNDTISLESVVRSGNSVESDEVDRFPRVRIRHTNLTLDSAGGIRHLTMDIRTPSENGADLIVNSQTGQWGTGHDESFDLGIAHLATQQIVTPTEKFTVTITASDATHGLLVVEWGTFRWTAPIVVD